VLPFYCVPEAYNTEDYVLLSIIESEINNVKGEENILSTLQSFFKYLQEISSILFLPSQKKNMYS
jgi:hypothetical protein